MKRALYYILSSALLTVLVLGILLAVSCSPHSMGEATPQQDSLDVQEARAIHEECNSAYYWRTVFQLDSTERQFLQVHDVGRLYIRLFDVVENTLLGDDKMRTEEIVPNATISFKDSVPVPHVVPTVYITTDALRRMGGARRDWAEKILTRVMNMCSYNGITGVEELQLDCDWTASTRGLFFSLCSDMKAAMAAREDTREMTLSSTIRLHQLSQSPPPMDCGVLMLYNTGSFRKPGTNNSLLSYDDVAPYLDKLQDYPLHLDFAYPIYRWALVYRNDHFEGLLRDTDLASLQTEKRKDGRYRVMQDGYIGGKKVMKDDIIRIENSDYNTVMKVKNAIEQRVDGNHATILYHLATDNITRYKEEEINEMYKCHSPRGSRFPR